MPLFLTSCENDLEVIGEWKEIAVVYGLLDPAANTNYVRVEKAFLGEGNAFIMAQQHDSIYYDNTLSVVLERRKNGQLLSTILMERDTTVIKEPGTFSADKHVLYKTSEKIFSDSQYNLLVHNEKSGYSATSNTPVVDSVTFVTPSPGFGSINWTTSFPVSVTWSTGPDTKIYELVIRFYYGERKLNDLSADTSYIDWIFPVVKSKNTNGNENLSITVTGDQFYEFVDTKLEPPHPDTVRVAGKLEFIITSGAEELSTYLDIANSSPGIAQSTPFYTNINNGRGLFSSRTTQTLIKNMNSLSIDQLACGEKTKHLRFLMNNQQQCPQ